MRRPFLLLLMIVALVAAGCGGDDDGGGKAVTKDQYAKQLGDAGRTLQKTFSDISDETGAGTSGKEVGSRMDEGAAALDAAAKKFKGITPPSDVKSAHEKFIQGFEEIADLFRKGADAARKNDTTALSKTLQGLQTGSGTKKLTEAQKELEAKGVTLTDPSK
jgi:hypothetical protein